MLLHSASHCCFFSFEEEKEALYLNEKSKCIRVVQIRQWDYVPFFVKIFFFGIIQKLFLDRHVPVLYS